MKLPVVKVFTSSAVNYIYKNYLKKLPDKRNTQTLIAIQHRQ